MHWHIEETTVAAVCSAIGAAGAVLNTILNHCWRQKDDAVKKAIGSKLDTAALKQDENTELTTVAAAAATASASAANGGGSLEGVIEGYNDQLAALIKRNRERRRAEAEARTRHGQ